MPLRMPDEWKFEGCGFEMPTPAHREFLKLIDLIVQGIDSPQGVFEEFKSAFGCQGWSSDVSWAESDMQRAMGNSRENAALYVASF
jgi:hypothetical protein